MDGLTNAHKLKHLREFHERWDGTGLTANFIASLLKDNTTKTVRLLDKSKWHPQFCGGVQAIVWSPERIYNRFEHGYDLQGNLLTRKTCLKIAYKDAKVYGACSLYRYKKEDPRIMGRHMDVIIPKKKLTKKHCPHCLNMEDKE